MLKRGDKKEKLSIIKSAIIILLAGFAWTSCNNSPITNTTADTTTNDAITDDTSNATINKDTANTRETPVNEDWLLIPGVSAGQTKINGNADSVYQRLGTPDGGDAAMMKAVAIWYTHHDSTNHSIAIYTSKNPDSPAVARILQIRITSPAFKTAEGIHTGSTLDEIKKYFEVNKAEQYTDAGVTYTVYDSYKGIAFEMAPDATCVAIIIHNTGANNLGTYLKFRTTNKFIKR